MLKMCRVSRIRYFADQTCGDLSPDKWVFFNRLLARKRVQFVADELNERTNRLRAKLKLAVRCRK